jgi:hypothetical protein
VDQADLEAGVLCGSIDNKPLVQLLVRGELTGRFVGLQASEIVAVRGRFAHPMGDKAHQNS